MGICDFPRFGVTVEITVQDLLGVVVGGGGSVTHDISRISWVHDILTGSSTKMARVLLITLPMIPEGQTEWYHCILKNLFSTELMTALADFVLPCFAFSNSRCHTSMHLRNLLSGKIPVSFFDILFCITYVNIFCTGRLLTYDCEE